MSRRKNRAQSFAEYAVVIALTAAALLGMRVYIVRTMQEKFRSSADVFGGGEQYVRGATNTTSLDGPLTNLANLPTDTFDCSFVQGQVGRLEGEIAILNEQADAFDAQAAEMEAQAQILLDNDMAEQAEQILVSARSLRERARENRQEAQDKQDEVDRLKAENPDCFS